MNLPGVPGGFNALFIGVTGVIGTSTLVCFSLEDMYPKPMSETCGWGTWWVVTIGGPANGFRPALVGPMGELTDVASANLAVRGVLMESVDEELEVRGRTLICAPFFSSDAGEVLESSDILATVDRSCWRS